MLGHASSVFGAILGQFQGRTPPRHLIETYGLREGYTPTRTTPGWTRPKKVVVRARSMDRAEWLARAVDEILVVAAANEREALKEIADADGVIGFCSPAILEKGKKLRWVQVGSAGVDRYVNIPGMQERHEITLTNMQRIYGPEIAEHVFGMLLALTRGLAVSIPMQQKGVWGRSEIGKRLPFVELRGKTLLVVGLGGIGTEVARIGHVLGMRVIATRNSRRSGPPFVEKVGLAGDLLALTREADVVVNCTPLTPQTTRLFNADYFAAMKPTAYFINIGRGRSVVTAALMKALEEKKIAGAGLDVTDPEPLPPDHPLWKMERVVITPHVSARSDLRIERVWKLYRENLRRFVAGERLLNKVDKKRGY
jgi:phosphoglycerate dehydrogenase-like enzyme